MTTFALQAQPTDAASWLELARRAETAGFGTLQAADHPGSCAAPYVALAAAAAVTSQIRLGAYVANAGVREPLLLAADVATLDVVSGGRAHLGLGAGHTPAEWRAVGLDRPDVAGRVGRCLAVAEAVRGLLDGQTVTADTPHLRLFDASLDKPRPVQEHVPLLLGTANTRMLRWAGAHADIVGLTGFGRTLPDGHRHDARWRLDQIDAQVEAVRSGATGRDTGPELEALVQVVEVTDDAEAVAAAHAEELGMSVNDLLEVPFVLVGTIAEIQSAIERHEKRWGITRYAVRAPAFDAVESLGLLQPGARSDSR
ncbi:TIGR03621 family F420-dependent LLM class oxidoreductase [Actinoplanes derwentensis]|uniref:Probable F420-dependent oxidoreductase, MSMEG_2516 family n=1 Tax=Actinoplanes derwentensis TaxID=113562 RepID=A0A1H2DBK6_9ACTN|nr:TIGR03621 family F420-dependent LLM class oxidoreductase [Actinoplanes derwentensis]GID87539.1 LLM class F420-dependent oxidoreductase [Actinoplanes derwentensis]SDT80130.1 probable F420-dependent oxidoreductase, MSMEG_2516 family [Actinoplanes derwentensis]